MEVISFQARRFQLTLNQPELYNEIKDYLMSFKAFKFLKSCREKAPETGHEHIHIYVCFNNGTRLSQTRIRGAHLEICRGSNKQNIAYIEKNGDIIDTIGEEPHQGSHMSVSELMAMKDPYDLPAQQFRIWKDVTLWNQSMTRSEMYKPGVKVFIFGVKVELERLNMYGITLKKMIDLIELNILIIFGLVYLMILL